MTDKQKEKAKRQLIKQIDRSNRFWTFNGRQFESGFNIWAGTFTFNVKLFNESKTLRVLSAVTTLGHERLSEHLYEEEKLFEGENTMAQALEWLADRVAELKEKIGSLYDLSEARSRYEQDVNDFIKSRIQA